jgi:hypothetical protein
VAEFDLLVAPKSDQALDLHTLMSNSVRLQKYNGRPIGSASLELVQAQLADRGVSMVSDPGARMAKSIYIGHVNTPLLQLEQRQSLRMPAKRQTRAQTRLRNACSMSLIGPGIGAERPRSPQPPPWEDIDLFGTSPSNSFDTPTREALLDPARTEPSTPDSPSNRAARDRTLKRERSVHYFDVQAVLHFDRSENDLQPWHW